MGLTEQVRAGARLSRKFIQFPADVSGIGSASLGSAYALINLNTSVPCRIRLYDNENSRDNATEISRQFGDTNIADNIALIGDFSQSVAGTISKIDPTLYSVTEDGFTYYRITPPGPMNVSVVVYNIEDSTIDGNFSRKDLPPIVGTLEYNPDGGTLFEKGIIDSPTIPTTYLLVSASSAPDTISRLRLYSVSSSLDDQAELTRSFDTEVSASAYLIVDMIISGSQPIYFSPKIIAANLDNMGTDLENIRADRDLINGKRELYYVLENKDSSSSGPENIEVSLHVFSLED
jgi:hypothetical protein